jgi:hypothetical protein
MEWKKFKSLLLDTFVQGELDEKALNHLEISYHEIEKMWNSFNKDVEIQRVILGEAPLFKNESYIYNPKIENSSFLRPSDFPGIQSRSKESLLSLLREYGVAIVDSYPFAFNDCDTPCVTFSSRLKQNRYHKFLHSSFNLYGAEKIIKILKKNPKARVSFRYLRNDKLLGQSLDQIVAQYSSASCRHPCLFGNISIDRIKLHEFLE